MITPHTRNSDSLSVVMLFNKNSPKDGWLIARMYSMKPVPSYC